MSEFLWLLPTASAEVSALGPLMECDAEDLDYTGPVDSLGEGCFEFDVDTNRRNRVKELCGDILPNPDDLLVISAHLHEFLVAQEIPDLNFLDVKIWHGRKGIDGYKVVQFLKPIGCIDAEESTLVYHEHYPDFIWEAENLTFKPKKLKDAKLFKAKGLRSHIFVSEGFLKTLQEQGFVGCSAHPLSEIG